MRKTYSDDTADARASIALCYGVLKPRLQASNISEYEFGTRENAEGWTVVKTDTALVKLVALQFWAGAQICLVSVYRTV